MNSNTLEGLKEYVRCPIGGPKEYVMINKMSCWGGGPKEYVLISKMSYWGGGGGEDLRICPDK